jgi:hypothetical protein
MVTSSLYRAVDDINGHWSLRQLQTAILLYVYTPWLSISYALLLDAQAIVTGGVDAIIVREN